MSMVGTPVVEMHLEAHTPGCTCRRLPGCGGIDSPDISCSEHGQLVDLAPFHTHAKQVRQVNRGRWVR